MKSTPLQLLATEITEGCLARRVQKLQRECTALYDASLYELGITSAQLILLAEIHAGNSSASQIAGRLKMSPSSLSRSLSLLKHNELIKSETKAGKRLLRLTPGGKRILKKSETRWREAQEQFLEELGTEISVPLGERELS